MLDKLRVIPGTSSGVGKKEALRVLLLLLWCVLLLGCVLLLLRVLLLPLWL